MRARLPKFSEIVSVFAVIVFFVYGWMLWIVIWKIPSWLYLMSPSEIVASLAYSFNEVFWESLFMLGLLLLACMILPARFLRHAFVVRASWAAFVIITSIIAYFYISLHMRLPFWIWTTGTLSLAGTLGFLSTRWSWLSRLAVGVSDKLTIFLYVHVPLSLLAILLILFRNFV